MNQRNSYGNLSTKPIKPAWNNHWLPQNEASHPVFGNESRSLLASWHQAVDPKGPGGLTPVQKQLSALYRGHTSENLFQGSLASLAVCISKYIQIYICVCFYVRNISRLQFTQMQVRVYGPDRTRRSVFPHQLVMDKTPITKCYDIYNDEPSGKTSPNWFCSRWGPVAMRACHGIVPSGSTLVLV